MATEGEIVSVLRYLSAAYPRSEMQDSTVAVYVIQLMRAGTAADALLLAAMNLIDISQWLPTVAELGAEARRIEGEREGWYATANYRLYGHPLPVELRLPFDLARHVLGETAAARLEEG